jgi:hypothetical protein
MPARYRGGMEWIENPSVGDWLRDRLDDDLASMHSVVPRGYAAYARVFHTASVRSLPDRRVPTSDEWDRMPEQERSALFERLVDAPATWAETAAAFGTTMHPLAQWNGIVRTPPETDWRVRSAPDGREFSAPLEGELAPEQLAAVADHLAAHTSTPDAGVVALWEGFGGLLGHLGHAPSRAFVTVSDDPNHQAMLNRSTHDPFNNVFRKPTWQEGILSKEISQGPRLSLPNRAYVLFSGSPRAFIDPAWVLDAPWRDIPGEQHGFAPSAQAPNIFWPEDRAWVMVSEIDFDSTVVAGSAELIRAICADDRLEALPIPEGADLGWQGDRVNGA